MKSIRRLSLTLIMFSLFSISYLVTSISAQTGMNPGMNRGMNPAMNLEDEYDMTWDMRGDDHEGPATFDDGLMGAPGAPPMRGHTPGMNPGMRGNMVAPHLRPGGAGPMTGVGAAANQDAPGSSAAGQQFQTSTFLLGSQGNAGAEGKAGITLPQIGLTNNMNPSLAEQTPGAKPIADTILRNHAPTQAR